MTIPPTETEQALEAVESSPGIRWELVPGSIRYTAKYEYHRGEVKLHILAEGVAHGLDHGWEFTPVYNTSGSWMFEFQGWISEHHGINAFLLKVPYTMAIGHPPPLFPLPNQIIVRDGQHPLGHTVPITSDLSSEQPAAIIGTTPEADLSSIVLPRPEKIIATMGRSFTVSVDYDEDNTTIRFDHQRFELLDSYIKNKRMFWEFQPTMVGASMLLATIGNHFPIRNQRAWDVDVIVWFNPLNPGPVIPALTAKAEAMADKNAVGGDGGILRFIGGLAIARKIVHEKWPEAQLYEVQLHRRPLLPPSKPAHSPNDLSWLTCYFYVDDGHVTISDKGWWSDWDEPVHHGPIVGPGIVNWEKLTKELSYEDAFAKVVASDPQGFEGVLSARLYEILNPEVQENLRDQPIYEFTMTDHSLRSIGVHSKEVVVQDWFGAAAAHPNKAVTPANGSSNGAANGSSSVPAPPVKPIQAPSVAAAT